MSWKLVHNEFKLCNNDAYLLGSLTFYKIAGCNILSA